jgi:hypothetical protein
MKGSRHELTIEFEREQEERWSPKQKREAGLWSGILAGVTARVFAAAGPRGSRCHSPSHWRREIRLWLEGFAATSGIQKSLGPVQSLGEKKAAG